MRPSAAPGGRGGRGREGLVPEGRADDRGPAARLNGEEAVAALLAGPTAAEAKAGIETYVPAGTSLRSVTVENGVATVDLSLKFALGRDGPSLLARLSQVVHTATGPEGATKVRLLVEGGTPIGMFPGAFVAGPITVKYLETPNVSAAEAADCEAAARCRRRAGGAGEACAARLPASRRTSTDRRAGDAVRGARVPEVGGAPAGRAARPADAEAPPDGAGPTPRTRAGAAGARRSCSTGRSRLAIENDQVVRVIHVSTGKSSTPTPPGDYQTYAKIAKWWSVPFREWLLWAVPFNGGIAFHELAEVPPTRPRTAACARRTRTRSGCTTSPGSACPSRW